MINCDKSDWHIYKCNFPGCPYKYKYCYVPEQVTSSSLFQRTPKFRLILQLLKTNPHYISESNDNFIPHWKAQTANLASHNYIIVSLSQNKQIRIEVLFYAKHEELSQAPTRILLHIESFPFLIKLLYKILSSELRKKLLRSIQNLKEAKQKKKLNGPILTETDLLVWVNDHLPFVYHHSVITTHIIISVSAKALLYNAIEQCRYAEPILYVMLRIISIMQDIPLYL